MSSNGSADSGALQSGAPAKSLSEDRLGRDKWVANLVERIEAYHGGDSLTIAIYGRWGCGKTSLLNFVIEALQTEQSRIVVGRFNPWNFSQQDRLFSTFFATIARLLKKLNRSSQSRKLSNTLDALSVATAPAALANLGFISTGVKTLSDMAKDYADVLGDVERVKEETSEILRKSEKWLVIVIDDIDRLTQSEICQVFQLIKSVADFQNVVYVLAFDHNMVAKALDAITGDEGHAYLEKITNVVLRVPPLTERQIRKLLLGELQKYADRQREYDWNTKRVQTIIEVALKNFKTLRHMQRFSNALVATEGLTTTDIDFADHVALTLLHTLEPGLFDFVAAHPDSFVDDVRNRLARTKEQAAIDKAAIDAELAKLKSMTVEDARELLEAVFPKVESLYSPYRNESWGKAEWRTQSRACANLTTFSRYFVFVVDEGDLSSADKDEFWQAAQGVETLEAFLKGLSAEKVYSVYEYLADLDASTIDQAQLRSIITATIDIGDDFQVLPGLDDVFKGAFLQAVRALKVLLGGLTQEVRFELVIEALGKPPASVQMPSDVAFVLGKPKHGLFTDPQSRELVDACRALFKASWDSGSFVKHPRFLGMLPDWLGRDGETTDAAATVRTTLAEDDERFLELLSRYENVQLSHYEPDRFNTKYLTQIYSLEELRARLQSILEKAAFQSQRTRLEELTQEVDKQIAEQSETSEVIHAVEVSQPYAQDDDLPRGWIARTSFGSEKKRPYGK